MFILCTVVASVYVIKLRNFYTYRICMLLVQLYFVAVVVVVNIMWIKSTGLRQFQKEWKEPLKWLVAYILQKALEHVCNLTMIEM